MESKMKDLYEEVKNGVSCWGECYIPTMETWLKILKVLEKAKDDEESKNTAELPTRVTISLSAYYMEDYDSSHELMDYIVKWFDAEYGKHPIHYEYDDESLSLDSDNLEIYNIVWR